MFGEQESGRRAVAVEGKEGVDMARGYPRKKKDQVVSAVVEVEADEGRCTKGV